MELVRRSEAENWPIKGSHRESRISDYVIEIKSSNEEPPVLSHTTDSSVRRKYVMKIVEKTLESTKGEQVCPKALELGNCPMIFKSPEREGIIETLFNNLTEEFDRLPPLTLTCEECLKLQRPGSKLIVYDIIRYHGDQNIKVIFGYCYCGYCCYLLNGGQFKRLYGVNWEIRNSGKQRVYPKYAWQVDDKIVIFKEQNTHALKYFKWRDVLTDEGIEVFRIGANKGNSNQVADLCSPEPRTLVVLYFDGAVRKFTADHDYNFTDKNPKPLVLLDQEHENLGGNGQVSWHSIAKLGYSNCFLAAGMVRGEETSTINTNKHLIFIFNDVPDPSIHLMNLIPPSFIAFDKRPEPDPSLKASYAIEKLIQSAAFPGIVLALSCHRYVHVLQVKDSKLSRLHVPGDPFEGDKRIGDGMIGRRKQVSTDVYVFSQHRMIKIHVKISD